MGGAIARADPDATAFAHRDATLSFLVAPKWTDPDRDQEMIEWAREIHEALAPYARDDVYANYLSEDGEKRTRAAYGDHYGRLVTLKDEWDPENLFSVNKNVRPTE